MQQIDVCARLLQPGSFLNSELRKKRDGGTMSKVVRYEFMGSWLIFWLLFISGVGLPFALLYLVDGTLRLDTEVDDPEKYVETYRKARK